MTLFGVHVYICIFFVNHLSARLSYAASLCRAAPLISVAPFSAIMIVGALVLVEVTAGITAALVTSWRFGRFNAGCR